MLKTAAALTVYLEPYQELQTIPGTLSPNPEKLAEKPAEEPSYLKELAEEHADLQEPADLYKRTEEPIEEPVDLEEPADLQELVEEPVEL